MTSQQKGKLIEEELAELDRVGNQPFQSFLPEHLKVFDLSVLRRNQNQPATPTAQ